MAALVAAATMAAPAPALAAREPPREITARSWILIDPADGEVLAQRVPDRRSAIASATKLMTAYLTLRELRPAERIVAPPYDANPAESLLGLRAGERISVRDLLYGLLLVSGNDAAAALAHGVSGSAPAFVADMNAAAGRLGLDGTNYANPIGFDHPANFSTARDLAELTTRLREEPLFRRIVDTPERTLRSGATTRVAVNRNKLVREVPRMSGVKTGFTPKAGNVLVGSAGSRGVDLVSVVLGAPTKAARDDATRRLLDYGLSLYERRTAVAEGETLAAAVDLRDEQLRLVAARRVRLTARDDQRVSVELDAPAEVKGSVSRGESLGSATVRLDGDPVATVELLAARAVAEASLLERADGELPGSRTVLWALVAAAILFAGAVIGILRVVLGSPQRGERA